jgi:N-methylhydantoinase B
VPGNYNPVATESFQEGFMMPPVKLFERGRMRQDIVDIMLANTRLPVSLYGDLNGQINALDLGVMRLVELLDEYGDTTVRSAMEELKQRAATLMRAHIAALPDGVYRAEDWLDNDGIVDEPLKLMLAIRISSEAMVLDFTGSAPACLGPVNISRSTTVAACYVAMKHMFREVPANSGVLEPIEFVIPETSILSVTAPKPVGGYTETILRLIDLVFLALAEATPDRTNAAAYGTINALSLAGYRHNGQRWVMFSFFGGGHGGHPEGDGLNHGNAPISTATIPPLEILEAAYPVMFRQWALRPDSGGVGRHRGGLGAVYEIELLEQKANAFLFGERGRFAPPGVLGGGEGALNQFRYEQDDGEHAPPLASKMVGINLARGQAVRLETPGGGGYGRPMERDPGAVAEDVRLGYVSVEAARRDYGVALDVGGKLDETGTRTLRSAAS